MPNSNTKQTKKQPKRNKKIKVLSGIVLGVFEDDGPEVRYSRAWLPKTVVKKMVVHGMSSVHGGEDMIDGLFGPLPVYSKPDYRALIYSFRTKAINTKDQRIADFGRMASIFIVFKIEKLRYILNSLETIEKLVKNQIEQKWQKESNITKSSIIQLYQKINGVIDVSNIRAFSYGRAGLIEYEDPQQVLNEGVISIIDETKKYFYMYLPPKKFSPKKRIQAISKMEDINIRDYGSQLTLKKIKDYHEFKKLLDKHSIQLIK
ncbi:MAG: hypothetical protein GF308_00405 [Candidatus Heimdallarchaeota archaeon]|nr:hypothetical protein [Candidatus Heimdallarchaeota archaeon]